MKNLPHFLQWFLGILLALALFWTAAGPATAQSVDVKSVPNMKVAAKQALPRLAVVKQAATAKGEPESSDSLVGSRSLGSQVPAGLMGVEEALGPEALAIAGKVHTGLLSCEPGTFIKLEGDPAMPGYFNMSGKNFFFRMVPVVSLTGAIRLEDRRTGGVWLQLPHKSMLMNQMAGQRMADECMSPIQASLAQHMKLNPGPNLLERVDPAPHPAGESVLTQSNLNPAPQLPVSVAAAPELPEGPVVLLGNLNPVPEMPASVAPAAEPAEVPVVKQNSALCRILSSSLFRFPRFCF